MHAACESPPCVVCLAMLLRDDENTSLEARPIRPVSGLNMPASFKGKFKYVIQCTLLCHNIEN